MFSIFVSFLTDVVGLKTGDSYSKGNLQTCMYLPDKVYWMQTKLPRSDLEISSENGYDGDIKSGQINEIFWIPLNHNMA